jgi:protease IV
MNKNVKWIILALILLPVVIGLFVLMFDKTSDTLNFKPIKTRSAALVRIEGGIYQPEKTIKLLREYYNDKSIAGVLLLINSPGGGVAASQEIYREIMRYKRGFKPIVVSMQSVAASGGYYIAAPALRIFADAGTITGSIGVIARWPRYTALFKKIGIEMVTMKAGKFKDLGNPERDMTEEERKILQSLLDNNHQQFITDMCNARLVSCDSLRALADGRIFTGQEAVRLGLIDTLGNLEDAKDYLLSITHLPSDSKLVEKKPRPSLWDIILPEEAKSFFGFVRETFQPAGVYYLSDFGL